MSTTSISANRVSLTNAIITGPTSPLGLALIDELLSGGVSITALCRPSSSRASKLPRSKLLSVVECDLEHLRSIAIDVKRNGIFFHLGWDGTIGLSRNDFHAQLQNVRYTLDAVELALSCGCDAFIGAGSQSEYGCVQEALRPNTPCRPETGYGIAKHTAYQMSRIMCKGFGIRHNWCRIFSLFGPNDNAGTLVMSTISRLLNNEELEFTGGEQIWDYLYYKDAAKALVAIAQKGQEETIYCLGSGKPRLLKNYIGCIKDCIDPNRELFFGVIPYSNNQVMHLEADISNLTADTGFTPQYTFEEGILETVAWMQENRAKREGQHEKCKKER